MIRLIKMAALALFGYAVYEFFRGMANDPQVRAVAQRGAREFGGGGKAPRGQVITGPGEGVEQETHDPDGASVRHKVGRGVIS